MELLRDIPSRALFPPGQGLGSKATISAHVLVYIITTPCLAVWEVAVGFTRGDESANNTFIEGQKHALLPCVLLILSTVSEEIIRKKLFIRALYTRASGELDFFRSDSDSRSVRILALNVRCWYNGPSLE
jgi:hypothetical protein